MDALATSAFPCSVLHTKVFAFLSAAILYVSNATLYPFLFLKHLPDY